jgi:uncharacterized protein YbgA (DUF1722 family)/uncharacterized protein YbbK (DUF523 family)
MLLPGQLNWRCTILTDQPAWKVWHDDSEPIRLGVSSCLLGRKVRFDGGHKRDRYLTDVLGDWVEWVSVCPEVEIGLGTPRPTIRLEGSIEDPRLVEPTGGTDLTLRMLEYSERRVSELKAENLDGYVLKRASPSCGMERVRVWNESGMPDKRGVGIFAGVLLDRWPNLPVEEEGRLNDPVLRENFVERIFCCHRWRSLNRLGLTRARLIAFHTAHKMLLRAHNEAGYRRLGKLVASFGQRPESEIFADYEDEFFSILKRRAAAKRHVNIMHHAVGYLRKNIDAADRRELLGLIEDYRLGLIPLIVPVTMLRHHVQRHHIQYLLGQIYLEPHPKELMLRNRV